MGRGRAKAKQTKVARELKYYSPSTDLTALQRELHGPSRFDELVAGRSADPVEPVDPVEPAEDDDDERWVSGDR